MEWIRENWFWVVSGVLFLWVHMRMHGSHGGHGGHGGHDGHGTSGRSGTAGEPEDTIRRNAEERHAQR